MGKTNENISLLLRAGPLEAHDVMRFRLVRRLGRVAEVEVDVYSDDSQIGRAHV